MSLASTPEAMASEDGTLLGGEAGGDGGLKLACPICHEPLHSAGSETDHRGAPQPGAAGGSALRCGRCRKAFATSAHGIVDLTVAADAATFEERQFAGTSIFQSPAVAYAYERGWRQGFAIYGFPGVEEEFAAAQRYLAPAGGGPLLDVSCGSGLFTRRFVAARRHALVVAADFSGPMLRQCADYLREDRSLDLRRVALVRADVARLPFETGSLAAVHAGAAIHCWPMPALAVAEISRVLRPGGVFVGSTFLLPQAPIGDALLSPLRQVLLESPLDPYRWWTEEGLRGLTEACGLVGFERIRSGGFILFAARKPASD